MVPRVHLLDLLPQEKNIGEAYILQHNLDSNKLQIENNNTGE